MTCIVAYKYCGDVYIGGDSAGVAGLDVRVRKDPKVFKRKGPNPSTNMAFGFTSSFRMGQLLMTFDIPKLDKKYKGDDYHYMITDFTDALIEHFKSKKYLKEKDSQASGGSFIVAWNGEIYEINDDFQVGINADEFSSVGCGSNYALGAMKAANIVDPRKRIVRSLEIASYFSGGVAPPFTVIKA